MLVHSILLAAALLIGGSSEIRKASHITVLLSDAKEGISTRKQVAVADEKKPAQPIITQKVAVKPVAKLPKAQEIIPKKNLAPLAPVAPQPDSDWASASEPIGIESPYNIFPGSGSGLSSVSSQPFGNSSGEADTSSTSRGQTGMAAEAGADASLKQRIRDALQANLIYPYLARKRRLEGTVLMKFQVNGKGMPEGVRIVQGSSYAILDEAARQTVLKTSPFPARNNIIEVPIRFSLQEN